MRTFIAVFSILLVAATAAPSGFVLLDKRDTVIADGLSVHNGDLPDWGFKYHASGYLAKGCPAGGKISTCYTYTLSDDPRKNVETNQYGNKVQNVTFFAPSHPADGKIRQYTFRMKIKPALVSTSADSCPLVGIETPNPDYYNNPTMPVYLDVRNNLAGIYAFTDTATPSVSIPLSKFTGKDTYQTWTLKSGPGGWADIKIIDEATGQTLLKYNATGQNSWGSYHMRVGTDRFPESGVTPMRVYWGDWVGKYL